MTKKKIAFKLWFLYNIIIYKMSYRVTLLNYDYFIILLSISTNYVIVGTIIFKCDYHECFGRLD